MTRIVAGSAGGRRLEVPPRGTRPTAERVREALFSALDSLMDVDGTHVLDLYAGSGALGFEALSRGAALATFVESNRKAIEVLKRNATALGLPGADVRHGTAQAVLADRPATPYHVLLADPPYAVDNAELTTVLQASLTWLDAEAIVVVERAARSGDVIWPAGLAAIRTKKYGDTVLHWAVASHQLE